MLLHPLPCSSSYSYCILLILLLSQAITQASSSHKNEINTSIYEVLRSHGLPMGLLPKGVSNFSLDDNGRFVVHLNQECNAKFENEVHYDQNVSGTLSYGQIGALSGISAQELFLWFPVKGIRVDIPSSGLIYFDVGVIYKQFSLSLFETPPDCQAVTENYNNDHPIGLKFQGESRKLRYERNREHLQRAVI
ncbi:uncharacterized protein LOC143889935 [Tasmannia lanceolata]|uniref:uncharacterized protein LOC143889935 n=1 Tax=Tasmannia lanceolata TaxID=3420 RepID=UPI0040639E9C